MNNINLIKFNSKVIIFGGILRDIVIGKTLPEQVEIDINILSKDSNTLTQDLLQIENICNNKIIKTSNSFDSFKIKSKDNKVIFDISVRTEEEMDLFNCRDFTVNALQLDHKDFSFNRGILMDNLKSNPNNVICLQHIQDKFMCPVENNIFTEDPLRVIRMITLSHRFGFTVKLNNQQRQNIDTAIQSIKDINPNRLRGELKKIFLIPDWLQVLKDFENFNVFSEIKDTIQQMVFKTK